MTRPIAVFDTECYRNFWGIAFKNIVTGNVRSFTMSKNRPLDRAGIIKIIRKFTLVSFNGINYDIPMLMLALRVDTDPILLKSASDNIIVHRMKPWTLRDKYRIPENPTSLDHIDLIEVAPGQASLKIYGGRLYSKRMQDLPIEPDAILTETDMVDIMKYCENDLDTTIDLYNDLRGELDLRYTMTDEYGIDLRSKSDAQIAEAVIVKRIEEIKGEKIYRPEYENSYKFTYDAPDFLSFQTPELGEFFELVKAAKYGFSEKDKVTIPTSLKGKKIKIGRSSYTFGNGGLHSNEKKQTLFSDKNGSLFDWDVASYYPSIILECRLSPEQLGEDFFSVYSGIKVQRLEAKRSGNKVKDSGLKIFLNGSFGKLGSKWSKIYAPKLMIQVTVTGQLALFMLIEDLELHDIPVVSGNTDGIVIHCPKGREDIMRETIKIWEDRTGFTMEEAQYKSIHSRDVNNYIAVKPDGKIKQKGAYAFVGSKGKSIEKNPTNYVCIDAVINYLKDGTPLEETIEFCPDFRRFLTVRKVKGGALWNDEYLGQAIRWYYAKGMDSAIHYQSNGNKVPKSDGAKPAMLLTGDLPHDIDYDWYVREAQDILADIGYKV